MFPSKSSRPIEIVFDFRLTSSERDSLIQDIVSDAQNVKNTIEAMEP